MSNKALIALLLGTVAIAGCGSSNRNSAAEVAPPPAASITDSDVENLLRIAMETRQEVNTLKQEVDAVKAGNVNTAQRGGFRK